MLNYTAESSKAFMHSFKLSASDSGSLDTLTFVVKDLMDVAGYVTGCGNPDWAQSHPKAVAHAICIEQLLSSGASCCGKTITDELAYSLIGENLLLWHAFKP